MITSSGKAAISRSNTVRIRRPISQRDISMPGQPRFIIKSRDVFTYRWSSPVLLRRAGAFSLSIVVCQVRGIPPTLLGRGLPVRLVGPSPSGIPPPSPGRTYGNRRHRSSRRLPSCTEPPAMRRSSGCRSFSTSLIGVDPRPKPGASRRIRRSPDSPRPRRGRRSPFPLDLYRPPEPSASLC